MQPVEFFGGKYQQPEQIVPGDVQTFRAQETSTGRTVFVHRLSTTGNEQEQTALLRLLLSSLFRSSAARSQVLDFGDEPGFCYVVTESAPQCLLLREWLQYELGADGSRSARPLDSGRADLRFSGVTAPPRQSEALKVPVENIVSTAPAASQRTPISASTHPAAEATRLFTANPVPANAVPEAAPVYDRESTQRAIPLAPKPVVHQAPPAELEPAKPEPAGPGAGEFTRMFVGGGTIGQRPAAPDGKVAGETPRPSEGSKAAPSSSAPAQHDPGDFTRFFKAGLPDAAPKATQSAESYRPQERPSPSPGFVQRPNSITPAPEPSAGSDSEFSRKFRPRVQSSAPGSTPNAFPESRFDFGSGQPGRGLPDLSKGKSDDIFNVSADVPTPIHSPSKEPGEYTRLFGSNQQPPAATNTPGSVPLAPAPTFDDPLMGAAPARPSSAAPSAAAGPSEFTLVVKGNAPAEGGAPAAGGPPAAGGHASGGSGGSGGAPPMDIKINPINPLQGAGMMTPLMGGSAGGGGVAGTASGPHASAAGASLGHASASSPVGSAQVGGRSMMPQGLGTLPPIKPVPPPKGAQAAVGLAKKEGLASKRNLIILFVILALLAIALIVVLIRQK